MGATRHYRRLLAVAATMALVVVVLGAYVRLSNAGLSCPDWPGCYGQLTVSAALANSAHIAAHYPETPLEPDKATKEMVHRYVAATLGLLICAIALLAWRSGRGVRLPLLLVVLVVVQALLGMWTVTLGLKPLVVTAHLIGGMGVLAMLWWLWLDTLPGGSGGGEALRPYAFTGLLLLAVQIALGGWTSSHYAGLACSGFPGCNGEWWPPADFVAAVGVRPLSGGGLIAIHWSHRIGAVMVVLYLGWLAWRSHRATPPVRQAGVAIALLLLVQFTLGIANVLTGLPLPLAAAHNAVAALLLLAVVTLIQQLAVSRATLHPGESS